MLAWDVLPSEAEARNQRVTRPLRRLANARVDPINLFGRQGQQAAAIVDTRGKAHLRVHRASQLPRRIEPDGVACVYQKPTLRT